MPRKSTNSARCCSCCSVYCAKSSTTCNKGWALSGEPSLIEVVLMPCLLLCSRLSNSPRRKGQAVIILGRQLEIRKDARHGERVSLAGEPLQELKGVCAWPVLHM